MSNVDLLKQGYQNFADGNVEAVLAVFHPDIEWIQCTGFPFITGDGRYVGPNAVVENIFAPIPVHYDGFNIEIQEFLESGDKVVMIGHYRGVWKETGKEFKANATHVWTVKDGKMMRFFQAVDTAEIINP
jgi:ketosteroid isomerase-like protein